MTKILKNTTGSDIEIKSTGFTILASSSYTIEVSEFRFWAADEAITEITSFITSGDIVVNDGINDLSATEGINHLKYPDFAFSQRFLSEPERSNSMSSKTTQQAVEEARPDIELDGTSILADVDIINFEGENVSVTPDVVNRKVTITINDDDLGDVLHFGECLLTPPECFELAFTDLKFLVDHTLCYMKSEEC